MQSIFGENAEHGGTSFIFEGHKFQISDIGIMNAEFSSSG